MTQLPLLELSRLRIAHRYLLKARVEITSYNLHKASPDPGVSRPQTSRLSPGSLKPSSLSNQCSPQRTWAENGFFQRLSLNVRQPWLLAAVSLPKTLLHLK